jgi:hypothetical protein
VVRQADGSFLADARAALDDVTAIVGPEFDVGEVAQEVDTLAGYVATRIGRVPVRGELVPGPGPYELEILDADPRRVKKLRIYRNLHRQNGQGHEARRPPPAAATTNTAAAAASPAPAATLAPAATSTAPDTTAAAPAPTPPNTGAANSSAPSSTTQLPLASDESVKLSPDPAPSKTARRP